MAHKGTVMKPRIEPKNSCRGLLAVACFVALFFAPNAGRAQAPVLHSFAAQPAAIAPGQSSTLSWNVSGATTLTLDPLHGAVTGASVGVTPSVTTTYTLTAANAAGTNRANATVTVGPLIYAPAYDSALVGDWIREAFENTPNDIVTDFAAVAPGRAGNAIEARWTIGFGSIGLANRKPGYEQQWMYLNEFRTVEFDIYFETNSTGHEGLLFVLEDFSYSDPVRVVDFIPGFASLAPTQQTGRWFHVAVDLPQIYPTIPRFHRFLLFNNSPDTRPHLRLMEVKLGRIDDTTPPVVTLNSATANPTYDQLTLNFSTDEPTLFRVEFGFTNFANTSNGPPDDWTTNHTATLTGLRPGSNVVYRLIANDHRTDTNAAPNVTIVTNTFALPPVPTVPPVISGLAASDVLGYRATLGWTTDRACAARLTYRKAGGANLTRTFPDLASVVNHAAGSVRPGDVVVTMGAGNVDEVARGLADRLR